MRKFILFLFSHRFLALARWESHFLAIRIRNYATLQRWRIRNAIATRRRPLFLNLGSGPRGVDDGRWINIDGFDATNVHFLADLSRPLPFPDLTFDGVFCEHVLEHFSQEDGACIAHEVFRILNRGGEFRVIVPDAELVVRRYLEAPEEMVAWRGIGDETPMEIVNSYFRQRYEHQFLYDWPTMEKTLRRAGFSKITRTTFGETGGDPRFAVDDAKYKWESLYVEAWKV